MKYNLDKNINKDFIKSYIVDIKNDEYEISEKTKKLNQKKEEFKKICSSIELFKDFSLKELVELQPFMEKSEIGFEYSELIGIKMVEKFPLMNKAHYYPELNELNELEGVSFEEICDIDTLINSMYKIKHIPDNHYTYIGIPKYDYDNGNKIIDFLIKRGILERYYKFKCCNCLCCGTSKSEEEFKKYLEMFKINSKVRKRLPLSIEESNKYYKSDTAFIDVSENTKYFRFDVWCDECSVDSEEGYVVVTSLEDLEKLNKSEWYKIIKKPDLSLDNEIDKYLYGNKEDI
ncbi:hypothetical protein BFS06_14430 [Clostridium perfringens]|uniref:Uncharacterized protein n=1 Tax=Clostridium perfringens TaxID=1502 RepID=A0A140GRC3_CLOPF|nr:hypothetical protein [Clostridium perfringens]AMN31082.1 hypothetical protein JFP838_pA0166 [Clostridium perfringens]TBX14403.1 hypothetical protein BFS06_14430 [Clostridium perfringens]